MIEATCSACGTLNRIAEADAPAGAKFVNCSSCKSRVALPMKITGVIPTIPKPTLPKMPPPMPKGPPPVTLGPPGTGLPPAKPPGPVDDFGLAELPAPKARQSPLGAEPASKPAPRSALSSTLDDLPAPRAAAGGNPQSLDLDELMGGTDLPAPRPTTSPGISDLPAPRAPAPGISDLPAPRGPARTAPQPVPFAAQPPDITDLPAPKARPAQTARPARPASDPVDLPAPRGGSGGITDLPAPKAGGISDLPMPKPGANKPAATPQSFDLDLPAPKGGIDLPAPKGFFDDLPQPAQKRHGEDIAPKGFFDDLPQPAQQQPGRDVAPKGFFDDLPQKATARPVLPERHERPEVPAPKGFFDDLPQPARNKQDSKQAFGTGGLPLEIGEDDAPIELAEQPASAGSDGISIGDSSAGSFDDLDLSAPSVGEQATPRGPGLGEEAAAVVKFGAGSKAGREPPPQQVGRASGANQAQPSDKMPLPSLGRSGTASDGTLELEEPKHGGPAKLQPKRAREGRVNDGPSKAARAKRSKILLGALLGVTLAGAGGFFFYKRHAAQQERADEIDSNLNTARKALVAEDANHWIRSAAAANKVIELDESNAEALGIAAEASFAGALADGKTQVPRFAKGRKLINDALANGITGPALDRAQALNTLTTAPDKAVPRLQALMKTAPKDGLLALYLGWAQAASGDPVNAITSFDQAMTLYPSTKVPALLGRARAKLAQADVEGARSDFNEVLAIQKDNIAAQVGIASTLPQSQSQQQESDLLAILERKDIKDADPRAVVSAYVLAGNIALRGRRLDVARDRFRKALALEPKDIPAITGLAETEMRDRKLEVANEQITKALTLSANDVRAQLVAAEIEIQFGKIDTAAERIQRLGSRNPPLPKLEQVSLQIVTAKLLEAQNKDEAAIDAYAAAAKLAGDFDLTPTMSAVAKLNEMSKKAEENGNPAKQAEYRQRADQLLSALADKAQDEPQLAFTLGVAYLQNGDPGKAESWLRKVTDARPTDADALYQYGKALGLLTKFNEAVPALTKARELAPGRAEIGLELAITYERMKNDAAAGKLYDELVAKEDAAIETRAHAGKYYVRTGKVEKAGEQGTKIVAADNEHAAGHYLKAEGALAQGRNEEARKEFGEAVRLERDARYLDGQGRAIEAVAAERNNDSGVLDQALNAYKAAAETDPLMFTSLLGQGRIYVKRREHAKALGPLLAAHQIRPDDPEAAFYIGLAYQALGEKKKLAIDWLERSLKRRPSAEAAFQLGELYTDPDVDRSGPAQVAYRRAVSLWQADEKAGKTLSAIDEQKLTDALWKLGNQADLVHNESLAKWAWERWVVRPGVRRQAAKFRDVDYALSTRLRTAGPPPPETPLETPAPKP
ncbi:MAG: tetratricopeptide repeat protein [Deltaproteobacteria bacterium]|nr:tetratricopeptide repeat protein [Deltaproteobacteria bacterium]